MEEILKKYGISKQLFLKVTKFIKLQVDLNMVNTLTDQEQIAAEILIMACDGKNTDASENTLSIDCVTMRSEQLKGNYKQSFLDWKSKYFIYEPTNYEYKSIKKRDDYMLHDLHRKYRRAMGESPFN